MRALGQEEASELLGQSQQGKDVPPPEKVTLHPAGTGPKQHMAERGRMVAR